MVWALGPTRGQSSAWDEIARCGRTLDKESDGLGVVDLLEESELLLSEGLLVDESSVSEDVGSHVLDRVLSRSTADELESGEGGASVAIPKSEDEGRTAPCSSSSPSSTP
jgi:hypothetical protein